MQKRVIVLIVIVLLGVMVMMLTSRFSPQPILSSAVSTCTNGMTNYPDCNNAVCQPDFHVENNVCVNDCAVQYTYQKISEEIIDPIVPDASGTQIGTLPADEIIPEDEDPSLDSLSTNKIEDSADFDFSFSNPTLQSDFMSYSDNVRLKYNRVSRTVDGKFDIGGKTHVCKPLILPQDTDIFAGNSCDAMSGDILTCQEGESHSISYECNKISYEYILKRCIPVFPPITLTSSTSPTAPMVGQTLTWKVIAEGGDGVYTYAWTGSDGLTGTGASVSKTYTTPGLKSASVTVTSANQSTIINLSSTVLAPPLSVTLTPPTGTLYTGRALSFIATPSGGTPPYTYSWSGTDSLTGMTSTLSKTYTTAGQKTATVTVKSSDGQTQTVTKVINVITPRTPLSVTLTPPTGSLYAGKALLYNTTISGGTPPYTYNWTGSDGISGTASTLSKTYTIAGQKRATVIVKSSDGQTQTVTNVINVTTPPPLRISCTPSASLMRRGQSVTWKSNVTGGTGIYTYSWSGTDGLTGRGSSVIKGYTNAGIKTATVFVTSGTQSLRATCKVTIQ